MKDGSFYGAKLLFKTLFFRGATALTNLGPAE
jgi:hypothetical protein